MYFNKTFLFIYFEKNYQKLYFSFLFLTTSLEEKERTLTNTFFLPLQTQNRRSRQRFGTIGLILKAHGHPIIENIPSFTQSHIIHSGSTFGWRCIEQTPQFGRLRLLEHVSFTLVLVDQTLTILLFALRQGKFLKINFRKRFDWSLSKSMASQDDFESVHLKFMISPEWTNCSGSWYSSRYSRTLPRMTSEMMPVHCFDHFFGSPRVYLKSTSHATFPKSWNYLQ